ncbi:hypothetical protein FOMPIDRAFT_24283, partial [Fomitopsis schrenkii]
NSFQVLHFSWYNRHATKGTAVPSNVHPLMIGKEDGSRMNYTQLTPYQARDFRQHEDVYAAIERSFTGLFEWVEEELQKYLPLEVTVLSASIEELPGKQRPLVAPFSNLVVNLNVATKAHRDVMDKEFCLVLAIGDFDEGDLCLHEPGLVLGLRNGDLAVFRSANITHFNRHF